MGFLRLNQPCDAGAVVPPSTSAASSAARVPVPLGDLRRRKTSPDAEVAAFIEV
jgi:hypothetical protein